MISNDSIHFSVRPFMSCCLLNCAAGVLASKKFSRVLKLLSKYHEEVPTSKDTSWNFFSREKIIFEISFLCLSWETQKKHTNHQKYFWL